MSHKDIESTKSPLPDRVDQIICMDHFLCRSVGRPSKISVEFLARLDAGCLREVCSPSASLAAILNEPPSQEIHLSEFM
jgi:hypothetical protein